MGAVTTFGPLMDRVYEVLCEDTSATRKLASGARFVRGYPPAAAIVNERAQLAREALSLTPQCLGTCFVDIADQASTGSDPELGSVHIYPVVVVISCDYYFDWFATNREKRSTGFNTVAAAQVRFNDHFPKIVNALCYAGAHNTTIGGTDTGLCTGALVRAGATRSAPAWNILDGGAGRLANVQVSIRAEVEWTA